MLLTSSTAFFFFFFTLSTFPSTPKSIGDIMVQVKYSRHPVRRTEGQPLTLKCSAYYQEEQCGNISVCWCLSVGGKLCQPLTDPDRYHINEIKVTGETVSFVTFMQLNLNDTGFYQCKAVCQRTSTTAMGHLINVTVTGKEDTTNIFFDSTDTNKGPAILIWRGRCSGDLFLLAISIFNILWIHDI